MDVYHWGGPINFPVYSNGLFFLSKDHGPPQGTMWLRPCPQLKDFQGDGDITFILSICRDGDKLLPPIMLLS